MNSIHILPPYLSKINSNIVTFMPKSSNLSLSFRFSHQAPRNVSKYVSFFFFVRWRVVNAVVQPHAGEPSTVSDWFNMNFASSTLSGIRFCNVVTNQQTLHPFVNYLSLQTHSNISLSHRQCLFCTLFHCLLQCTLREDNIFMVVLLTFRSLMSTTVDVPHR